MKRFLLAGAIAALIAGSASAAPLPYVNTPYSTPQELVNGVISSINSNVPTAASLVQATSSAGAVTIQGTKGFITTESLSTAAGAVYTLTITDASISANSIVMPVVGFGTATTGVPTLTTTVATAGSAVIKIQNIASAAALNGTLTVGFLVVN